MKRTPWITEVGAAAATLILCLLPVDRIHATTFFDDLSAANGGAESVSGSRWLAGTFKTDAATYTSLTATLLMAQSSAGTAQLQLYSDGNLVPGSLISTFTSPASYSATLANSSFTLSGVSLTAHTSYWLVLKATSGSYDWGWTSDFLTMNGWADSPNAGSAWFSSDVYPLQYKVVSGVALTGDYNGNGVVDAADYVLWRDTLGASGVGLAADGDGNGTVNAADYAVWMANCGKTAGAGTGTAATPEPTSAALAAVGLTILLLQFRRRRIR